MDYNKADDTLRNLVGINPVIQKLEGITSIGNRFSQIMSAAQTITPAVNDNLRSIVGSLGNITSQLPEATTIGHSMGNALNPLIGSLQIASQFKYEGALSALSELSQAIIATRDEHLLSSRQIITDSMIDSITPILSSIASASTLAPAIDTSNAADILHSIENAVTDYSSDDISEEEAEEMYSRGEITDEDIEKEVESIFENPESLSESPTEKKRKAARKKALTKVAFLIAQFILGIIFNPVINHITEGIDKKLGVSQMWEESGVFEWIDNLLGLPQNSALTEEEAKSSVNTENIGNQSKQNREDLLAKIQAIRTYIASAPQDENTDNLLSYLSDLEKDVNGKKYGLVFEEHRETIDEVLDTHIPVLTEEPELLIDNGGEMNFLLEGDNLAALQLLEKTHRGKIDLIYIDPPYNTGNKDFVYDDSFVDSQDTFRHSKWLSFIGKRLSLAKSLLSEKGVIFISIDDREQAGLKMLCDSIFDESCFVADVSWQRTYSMRNDVKGIAAEVEHLLVYSKSPLWQPHKLARTEKMDAKYKNVDNDPRGPWRNIIASAPSATTHQGMVYAIQHPFSGALIYPPTGRCWPLQQSQMLEIMCEWCEYELKDLEDYHARAQICNVDDDSVRKDVMAIVLKQSIEISSQQAKARYQKGQWPQFFFTKGGKGTLSRKAYLNKVGGRPVTNFWSYDEVGHTDEAARMLKSIFDGQNIFDTPKPVRLIDRIIAIASQPDSTILDFFAGSGTTGHAVLAYNAANSDSYRKFILCTNNENDICRDVTYERIKRVIKQEEYVARLKYYRIDYVPISEQLYYEYADELLLHVRELVELENGVNFTENAEIAIVLTDDELTDFIARPEDFSKCHTLYLGHDILPTGEQDALLKERDILVHIIPDYYYRGLEG